MSRSYKKSPVATCAKTRGMKQLFNRKIRRSRDENSYKSYRKRNNSWDICDFKCYSITPESEWEDLDWKAYRRK